MRKQQLRTRQRRQPPATILGLRPVGWSICGVGDCPACDAAPQIGFFCAMNSSGVASVFMTLGCCPQGRKRRAGRFELFGWTWSRIGDQNAGRELLATRSVRAVGKRLGIATFNVLFAGPP